MGIVCPLNTAVIARSQLPSYVLNPAFLGDITYIQLLNNRARVVFSPLNS